MKRVISLLLTLALLCSLLPVLPAAAVKAPGSITRSPDETHYTYRDIVSRTYDMSYLATPPKPGEGGKQVTSTDPASQYNEETGKYENWSGNLDNSNYVRMNPDNGYRVLADLEGPGYLTRMWIPTLWEGRLHIYIDGSLVIDTQMADFIWGSAFSEFGELSFQANHHDTAQFGEGYLGGINLFVPITYNESCVVEIDCGEKSSFYYIVGYYDLEDGASVESFQWPLSADNHAALQEANAILDDESIPAGNSAYRATVDAGETVTLFESGEAGAISSTALNFDIESFNKQTSFASWTISMYWDGAQGPAVSMSVADFYGVPYGSNPFDSAGFGVAEDGTLYSKWYMPYNSAKITLTNNSDAACAVSASLSVEALTDAEANELTRFHANWQRSYAREDDRAPDAQLLYVEGAGRFVGTVLHLYQFADGIWWGEGDEKFFIDGEKYPTWFGTGSEDYFCYAWCGSTLFDYPYCGQPQNDGTPATGEVQVQGHGDKVNYRLHITDNVCFRTSFDANIEKYYNDVFAQYAATTFFYLTKESTDQHTAVAPILEERLFNNNLITGSSLFYPGIYLNARVIDSNTAITPWLQGMQGIEGLDSSKWYGEMNYFWNIASRGKYIEYLLDIPDGGRYSLTASMTTAPDYGIFDFYIDGTLAGTVDTYGSLDVKNSLLGELSLTPGAHILRIECAGKNYASGGYFMGLNYFEFTPVAPTISKHFFGGVEYLLPRCTAFSAGEPIGQGMGVFASDAYTWHNNEHLIWNPGEDGTADFTFEIDADGMYTMELGRTLAADFGIYDILIDGLLVAADVDAYRPGGVFGERSRYYSIPLTAGTHTLRVQSKGKNGNAVGTLIGIDYISFETQTEVGAFYGGYNDLLKAFDTEKSTAQIATQELGWVASNVWYHNNHLFWNGAGTAAVFAVELPETAEYTMSIDHTVAGDYGKFEIYIDDVKLSDTIDGFSAAVGLATYQKTGVRLSAGSHTLRIEVVGRNEASAGEMIGISSISFLGAYENTGAQGGSLTGIQREAYAELRDYADEALKKADALQKPHVRMEMALGLMRIAAAAPEEVSDALDAAKAAIIAVLQTAYEPELEVDMIDDLFYEGGDMRMWVKSYTSEKAPDGQGLDSAIWSNGAQLFWIADKVGDEAEIALQLPYDGEFGVSFAHTTAGDYCDFDIYLDDVKLASVNSYGTIGVQSVEYGRLTLTAGEHILRLVITGKPAESPAFGVGIDHLLLTGVTGVMQYRAAAYADLDGYKQKAEYSTAQWAIVQQTIAEQKAVISVCDTVEAVVAAWRAARTALDAIDSGLIDYDSIVFDAGKLPADFGWQSDNENFVNWQVTESGETFYVSYNGSNSKRIWKELIEDPDNFTLKVAVKVEKQRAELEIMGVHIELNCEQGNGNQIFDRETWQWFNAEEQVCEVTVSRANGGDLTVKLLGRKNETPLIFTKTPVDASNKNVYIGVLDNGGSAFFSDISCEGAVAGTPGDFGWETDEVEGVKDFSGWTASDAANLSANYSETVNEHRVWKNLLTDQDSFTARVTLKLDSESSAYLKVLGQIIELDGRNGDGNQLFVKANGDRDWIAGCTATVYITRENGNLLVDILGEGAQELYSFELTPTEENENLELGIYEGAASYSAITVGAPERPQPPEKQTNPGDFGWETDEIEGTKDFSGWTATDEANLRAVYAETVNNHRIWKGLLANQNDFTIDLDLVGSDSASAYLKVLGVTLELDGRGGDGNQMFVKLNGENKDWVVGTLCAMHVKVERTNGGDLTITVTGRENETPLVLTAAPSEENENLELGLYAGTVDFNSIAVESIASTTYTVTWSVNGVETKETYEAGATPRFKGSTDKPADSEYTYTFTGWSPEIAPVTADVTYTAQYSKTPIAADVFVVTWNVNGAETTEIYEAGATPVFKGTTAKADDQLFTYTFVGWSPAIAPVTANVTHTAQYERAVRSVTPSGKFTDVPKNQWYYDEVYTAEGLGLMNGMSAATFEPEGSMTRAMLVTVLWRVEGSPTGSKAHSFTDVESGRWYTEAVSWAAEKGIVNGITTTTFEPETEVTREQLATILYRYAKHKGYTLTGGAELTVFPDGGEVSNYAKEAVSWAVAAGIIGGSKEGGTLRLLPRGSATRAQVAAIFVRFVANIMA